MREKTEVSLYKLSVCVCVCVCVCVFVIASVHVWACKCACLVGEKAIEKTKVDCVLLCGRMLQFVLGSVWFLSSVEV